MFRTSPDRAYYIYKEVKNSKKNKSHHCTVVALPAMRDANKKG